MLTKESNKSNNLLQQQDYIKDPVTDFLHKSARDLIESVLKIEIEEYMKEINTNYDKIIDIRNG